MIVTSGFHDVGDFNRKFDLPAVPRPPNHEWTTPHLIDENTFLYRLGFLLEELHELQLAYQHRDLPGVADALVDLAYVVYGTAHFMGLPWDALWAEVQRANLAKTPKVGTKRGHRFDVGKPPDWAPPDVAGVLRRAGWSG